MIRKIKSWLKELYPAIRFKKSSYSQCGEDLIVKFIFDNIGIPHPSYIDIGAHHPNYINNTAIFYNKSVLGINIEPDPTLFKHFLKRRKNDININAGIGAKEELLDFYIMSTATLNSFSKDAAEDSIKEGYKIKAVKKIQVYPLKKIINQYANGKFPDFLNLDVEGLDMDILQSINYQNAPLVICVETISFSNSGKGVKDNTIINFLESKGYMVYADTYINTIFIKRDNWLNR